MLNSQLEPFIEDDLGLFGGDEQPNPDIHNHCGCKIYVSQNAVALPINVVEKMRRAKIILECALVRPKDGHISLED